jgi:2,4-dienoyl-CoA reductase-like NADH-dependent reductase (Old Yellow Enzyme family)
MNSDIELVGSEFKFPHSKRIAKNRIVKAAMTEGFSDPTTPLPNELHYRMYKTWSDGGSGILITGNVMVDPNIRENPRNICLSPALYRRHSATYGTLASSMKSGGALAIVQLSHAGRQSPLSVTSSPVAPSAVPLQGLISWFFAKPRELTVLEIHEIVQKFVDAATCCVQAGFDGIQIHAAHGYLLSSFLSPHTNRRSDDYGGNIENRMRIVLEIIAKVKSVVPPHFIVGVKLNSADMSHREGFTETDALKVMERLAQPDVGIDFVEISGGSYEKVAFLLGDDETKKQSTIEREAYFIDFATKARRIAPKLPLILTGGFRTLEGMSWALKQNATDFVGVARPLCLNPRFPKDLLSGHAEMTSLPSRIISFGWIGDKILGLLPRGGTDNLYFQHLMRLLAEGKDPSTDKSRLSFFGVLGKILTSYVWDPSFSKTKTIDSKLE